MVNTLHLILAVEGKRAYNKIHLRFRLGVCRKAVLQNKLFLHPPQRLEAGSTWAPAEDCSSKMLACGQAPARRVWPQLEGPRRNWQRVTRPKVEWGRGCEPRPSQSLLSILPFFSPNSSREPVHRPYRHPPGEVSGGIRSKQRNTPICHCGAEISKLRKWTG